MVDSQSRARSESASEVSGEARPLTPLADSLRARLGSRNNGVHLLRDGAARLSELVRILAAADDCVYPLPGGRQFFAAAGKDSHHDQHLDERKGEKDVAT
jgi:hypothetical protein